ncbi:hypothetical protein TRIUR3_12624 [Triticum urartu]|uniref:Uncharacterized protein n=1 Tax=Triticum urartu TaxID=4572 RepID=M7ZE57_TRIUA|nr:hypothetical protein TRIUR3_12624 [Triticum urartu]
MAALPPGYRFYPTEEELVRFYLRHKLDGSRRAGIERGRRRRLFPGPVAAPRHVYMALEEDGADADAAAPASNPVFQVRSEFSLCRLYTSSGNMRQFDRRPCTAVAGGSPPSSSAALASPNEDVEVGRGQKRKRHAANDNTSSSDAYRHVQQQQGKQEGADEELADDMTDWAELLAWI